MNHTSFFGMLKQPNFNRLADEVQQEIVKYLMSIGQDAQSIRRLIGILRIITHGKYEISQARRFAKDAIDLRDFTRGFTMQLTLDFSERNCYGVPYSEVNFPLLCYVLGELVGAEYKRKKAYCVLYYTPNQHMNGRLLRYAELHCQVDNDRHRLLEAKAEYLRTYQDVVIFSGVLGDLTHDLRRQIENKLTEIHNYVRAVSQLTDAETTVLFYSSGNLGCTYLGSSDSINNTKYFKYPYEER